MRHVAVAGTRFNWNIKSEIKWNNPVKVAACRQILLSDSTSQLTIVVWTKCLKEKILWCLYHLECFILTKLNYWLSAFLHDGSLLYSRKLNITSHVSRYSFIAMQIEDNYSLKAFLLMINAIWLVATIYYRYASIEQCRHIVRENVYCPSTIPLSTCKQNCRSYIVRWIL